MARGDKNPYKGNLGKLDTRGAARRTSQESLDAARERVAGKAQGPPNPELVAWTKHEAEDRARRTVIGMFENKGRAPMHVLSAPQFAQFKATGGWEGMPTPEEYGPHSAGPEDKEYEHL